VLHESRQLTTRRKKWRLVRAYLARRPVWCAWQVTYRCNFRCHICSYWQEPHTPAEELTVEQFARGAENLARGGSMLLILAGGEPLLRADLPDIVAALARRHFPFLTTNGWRVSADRARALWDAGLWGVSISIDYPDARRHDDRIAGMSAGLVNGSIRREHVHNLPPPSERPDRELHSR
jgi:MoaA/NifB/PqqE/SkfB family radical SAM enzyme